MEPAVSPSRPAESRSRFQGDWRIDNLGWRGLLGILGFVLLADFTLYPSTGFTGFATFSVIAPLLLWLGSRVLVPQLATWSLWGSQLLLSVALLWCGGPFEVLATIAILTLVAMTLAGRPPQILEGIGYLLQSMIAGFGGIATSFRGRPSIASSSRGLPHRDISPVLRDTMIPLGAVLAFALVFVLANPNLSDWFDSAMARSLDWLANLIEFNEEQVLRFLFWGAVAWWAFGMLRPLSFILPERPAAVIFENLKITEFYIAFRNTLLCLNILFAVYLIFEFATLWFRDFPEGFHYSGYAHRGAFWLTCALALATIVMTIIFSDDIRQDPRAPGLFRLAKIWAIFNLILAIAVYHRMWIYIDFNGMTRMRVVGLLGISTVVAGFCIVLWKITHRRDFLWMLRGYLWALAFAFYLYAILPVDLLVMRYNVSRILRGDEAPSVQISVHPIADDGLMTLLPLLDYENPIIRDGVAVLLEARRDELSSEPSLRIPSWKTYQVATEQLLVRLAQADDKLKPIRDPSSRYAAFQQFKNYAYQWY